MIHLLLPFFQLFHHSHCNSIFFHRFLSYIENVRILQQKPIASPPAPQVEPLDRYSVLIVRGAIVGSGLLGLALFVRNSRMFATYRNVKLIPSDFYELGIQVKGIVREVAPNGLLRVEHQPAVWQPRMLSFRMQPRTPVFSCRYLHTSPSLSCVVSEKFHEKMMIQMISQMREMTKELKEESEKVGGLRSDLIHITDKLVRTESLLKARELIDLFDGMCFDFLKKETTDLEPSLTQDERNLLNNLEHKKLAKRVLLYYNRNVRGFRNEFVRLFGKGMVANLSHLQAVLENLYTMRNLEAHPSVTGDQDIEVVLPKNEFSTSERALMKAMIESMYMSIVPKKIETSN